MQKEFQKLGIWIKAKKKSTFFKHWVNGFRSGERAPYSDVVGCGFADTHVLKNLALNIADLFTPGYVCRI
jgi:hypothetical protein